MTKPKPIPAPNISYNYKKIRGEFDMKKEILATNHIVLNQKAKDKIDAIKMAGKILVDNGYVEEEYISKMLEREELSSTYIGNYVAVPHGTEEAKTSVKSSGICVIQLPEGVDFGNGNIVHILIGIAAVNNEHLDILSKIAIYCSEEENVLKMVKATSREEILSFFEAIN